MKFKSSYGLFTRIIVVLAFFLMVVMNFLANLLPLNGQTTGEISDSYPNLFAPAGITFSIWGLIYILLACYVLYQLGIFRKTKLHRNESLFSNIAPYFILSSIANTAWIFTWHFHKILLSTVLIIVILACLAYINNRITASSLTKKETLFIRLPFSIYFGWITVATIANVTVLLVSIGWQGFGVPEAIWASIIISVGMLIGVSTIVHNRDLAYGLVLIWAYFGILIKHISKFGFNGQYPTIIAAVLACIAIFLIAEIYIASRNRSAVQ